MDAGLKNCPYCGFAELEVFTPESFAGGDGETSEPSLWCPQCLHHSFPNRMTRVMELLPPLSFAGYAEASPQAPQSWRSWLQAAFAFVMRKSRGSIVPAEAPPSHLESASAPARRRA